MEKKQHGGTHYVDAPMQPWDVIDATFTPEQQIGYYRGNVIKYAMRLGSKDERALEAKKAAHYAEKLAERLEALRSIGDSDVVKALISVCDHLLCRLDRYNEADAEAMEAVNNANATIKRLRS